MSDAKMQARVIFHCTRFGMGPREIGSVMGLSVSQVNYRLQQQRESRGVVRLEAPRYTGGVGRRSTLCKTG